MTAASSAPIDVLEGPVGSPVRRACPASTIYGENTGAPSTHVPRSQPCYTPMPKAHFFDNLTQCPSAAVYSSARPFEREYVPQTRSAPDRLRLAASQLGETFVSAGARSHAETHSRRPRRENLREKLGGAATTGRPPETLPSHFEGGKRVKERKERERKGNGHLRTKRGAARASKIQFMLPFNLPSRARTKE